MIKDLQRCNLGFGCDEIWCWPILAEAGRIREISDRLHTRCCVRTAVHLRLRIIDTCRHIRSGDHMGGCEGGGIYGTRQQRGNRAT